MAETYIRMREFAARRDRGRGTAESPKVHNFLLFLFRFCSFLYLLPMNGLIFRHRSSQSITNARTHSLTFT